MMSDEGGKGVEYQIPKGTRSAGANGGRFREPLHQGDNGSNDTGRHGPKVLIEGFKPVCDAQFQRLEISLGCDIPAYCVSGCGGRGFGLGIVRLK